MSKIVMKSFVLSAFLMSIFGCDNCFGMEDVETLVNELAADPANSQKLQALVEELANREQGKKKAYQAIDALENVGSDLQKDKTFEKIACMIWGIASDWCGGYQRVNDISYYVSGAKKGIFGPYYSIPDDPRC